MCEWIYLNGRRVRSYRVLCDLLNVKSLPYKREGYYYCVAGWGNCLCGKDIRRVAREKGLWCEYGNAGYVLITPEMFGKVVTHERKAKSPQNDGRN